MSSPPKKIKKRQYSRAGCIECKRRKVKCDEAQPACAICVKANKECTYPTQVANKKQKRKSAISLETKQESNGVESTESPPTMSTEPEFYELKELDREISADMTLFENIFDDANTLVNGLLDCENFVFDETLPLERPIESARDLKPFHSNIILNDTSKLQMFTNNEELESYLKGTDILNNPELAKSWYQFDLSMRDVAEVDTKEESSNVQLTNRIVQIHGLTPIEVQYFENIAVGNFLYYIFPFAANIENNEVMRILLEYLMVFKYLVYALMSVNAACTFTSTNNQVHDQQQRKFTAICMRLLVAAFADLRNNKYSLWHIEGLILTVLVLTMLFSEMNIIDTTKAPVSWVIHLQEARALLLKYNSIKSQSQHHKPESPGITLAKQFFFCYDWSSKMSLRVSEITTSDLEDLLLLIENAEFLTEDPAYVLTLAKLGMIIPATNFHTDFHTFTTINSVILKTMYKLIEAISIMNSKDVSPRERQVSPNKVTEIMSLIHEASKQKMIPGISADKGYEIPIDNVAHPFYPATAEKIYLPECAYGRDIGGAQEAYYSWCDVAIVLHSRFLYLKIVTSPGLLYLPRNHPVIKQLILEVMQTMFYIKPKSDPSYLRQQVLEESQNYYLPKCLFDYRAIMVQLPFRLLIDLTDDETDFEKLELFFKGLLRLGCGSCSIAISRIQEKRTSAQQRSESSDVVNNHNAMEYATAGFPIY